MPLRSAPRVPAARCRAVITAFQRVQPDVGEPGQRAPAAAALAASAPAASAPAASLSCEVLQGNAAGPDAPTAVLVHGILGSRRNLQGFAQMIVEGFPSWRVVLVDLRCHGASAAAAGAAPAPGPHGVDSAARDVLELLRARRVFPRMLIGHSFGGKVVLSMARQFGAATPALPRPVQVWVLDAPPGEARVAAAPGGDHPWRLIEALRTVPVPLAGRAQLVERLLRQGFSAAIAAWVTTSLRPAPGGGLSWAFDLDGIADMYRSYERSDLWDLLRSPPQGLRVDFVKATRSAFGWDGEGAIGALGHRVHSLDAGHWVHSDNPGGLFNILAPSLRALEAGHSSGWQGQGQGQQQASR